MRGTTTNKRGRCSGNMTPHGSAIAGWVVGRRKEFAERVLAAVVLVPGSVALVPMVLWSWLSFRANPIFRQRRVGKGGVPFDMVKLRTLPVTTPAYLDRGQLDEGHRTSGVAKLLRTTHLDELPQICHVLSGKMSLVGPRPMIEPIVEGLDPEFRRLREVARPGLTGLWQISVCGAERLEDYDPLDVAYLRAATLLLDARILYWTARQVFGTKRLTAERIGDSMALTIDSPVGRLDESVDEVTRFEAAV